MDNKFYRVNAIKESLNFLQLFKLKPIKRFCGVSFLMNVNSIQNGID